MKQPQPQSPSRRESPPDLRLELRAQWRWQLLLTLMILTLLVTVNQVFPAASFLARYLGGLPWFGWAVMIGFLAVVAVLFAWRDARRSRLLLEDPPEKFIDPNNQELCKKLSDEYDANGPDYPHPVIIEDRCIGCGACVRACPHDVFTMVENIAKPIALDQCMQDTSCQAVCPTTPVACIVVHAPKPKPRPFPPCDPEFMSKQVSGCYLIGDLSGRTQIKNAANQGALVIKHIEEQLGCPQLRAGQGADEYDVAIIGIGPAGLSATIRAERLKLKYVAIEQDKVLSTLKAYPKDKEILFRPDDFDPCSDIPIDNPRDKCENILAAWHEAMTSSGVRIMEEESCKRVTKAKDDDYFTIATEKKENNESHTYRALRVVLALGLRGTPMRLGGPGTTLEGETKDRVKYKLSKLDEFKDKRVMIVGGGNSAVEAALALAAQCGDAKSKRAESHRRKGREHHAENYGFWWFRRWWKRHCHLASDNPSDGEHSLISLAVRSGFTNDLAFTSKQKLYRHIYKDEITLYWDKALTEVCEGAVVLTDQHTHEKTVVPNDYILALIGGDFPTTFLETIGITIPNQAPRDKFHLRQALPLITGFLKRGLRRSSALIARSDRGSR